MILNAGTPSKKCFFQKMCFFGDLGLPSVILVNKLLKALRVSASKWCINIFSASFHCALYWLWHLMITQGPTRFFNGNFRGCKMANLRAAYNGRNSNGTGNHDLLIFWRWFIQWQRHTNDPPSDCRHLPKPNIQELCQSLSLTKLKTQTYARNPIQRNHSQRCTKQDHQWWRYHRRLLGYQSLYF